MPGLKRSPSKANASPIKSPSRKGQQQASPSSAPSPPSLRNDPQLPLSAVQQDDNELLTLAKLVADNAHLLVRGRGDEALEKRARQIVKRSFDQALESESTSFPHLSALLASLTPASGPTTRSAARSVQEELPEPDFVLSATPIPELTIDEGMDAEMIWEQMELRGQTVDRMLDEMFGQEDADAEDDEDGIFDEEDEEDEDEEDEETEDFGDFGNDSASDEVEHDPEQLEADTEDEEEAEYFRRLGEGKEEGLDSEDPAFDVDDAAMESEDESEERNDPLADDQKRLSLDNFDGEAKGKRQRPSKRAPGPPSAVDDDFFSLHDFHAAADEGEFEMAKMLKGENEDDDDDDDEEDEGADGGIDLFASIGGMDDDDEENEDEEEGDLDAGGVMYKDFFDPPPRPLKKAKPTPAKLASKPEAAAPVETTGKRGVRFSESVKVKTIPSRHDLKLALKKGKGKAMSDEELEEEVTKELASASGDDQEDQDADLSFDDNENLLDDDEEMMPDADSGDALDGSDGSEEGDGSDVDEGQEAIQRFKSELFDDEDEEREDSKSKNLSKYERRLLALSDQIAALEQQNIGPKDWATLGEAQSRDRPTNSLLDEDLEFERMGKSAPVVTEETTKGIEDLIKQRILDNNFDDVERRRAVDPNAFLPSRYLELQDTQSQKSLAEIYAEDYEKSKEKEEGRKVTNELDKDLEKRHQEIEDLFEELAGKLDALSNARFTPKAPKATIETVSNLPSISMESALPTTNSASTLLAPEEVYTASQQLTASDKSTLTPAQKKALRQKERTERKSVHEKVDRIKDAKLKKRGIKGEKERAREQLVGTKGVTVIGKGGKEEKATGKKRKRGDADGNKAMPTSIGLKL
ncbi:rRNA-processing protein MPP10 [Sporobolomyces koalae]|uniref:rRNA-processing protein MPP10 n=1 Tax=Sporobolomyces koalae TaxID=500713 RepID=UPI003179D051